MAKPSAASGFALPEKEEPRVCKACAAWRVLGSSPAFGMCMTSGKFLQAPLTMPDLASCSLWTAK